MSDGLIDLRGKSSCLSPIVDSAKMTDGFNPGEVRYIKLGRGGAWANDAMEAGVIPFGYPKIDHASCQARDWGSVRVELIAMGRKGAGATQGLRELADFYDLPTDTLWITFANGHLWWAFAETEVSPVANAASDGPTRFRRTLDGWRSHSLTGERLTTRSLSSALTRGVSGWFGSRGSGRGSGFDH